jgi:putative membrane protein
MIGITAPVATALLAAVPALAVAQPGWEGSYGHMWGGGFGLLGALMMVLFWGAIIVAVVSAARWLIERDKRSRRPEALEILKERFARGEIEQEEYEARRKVLDSQA